MNVLRVFWRGLMTFERYGATFVVANLVAMLVSIPLITFPAALAGLYHLANVASHEPTCHLDDFWAGFRANLKRGVFVALINAAVIGILITNFNTYSAQTGAAFYALRVAWGAALGVWVVVNLYVWAILERMEHPDLGRGFYNAALMVFKNPLFSALFLLIIGVVSLICGVLVIPLVLFAFSLIANISTAAVADRLKQVAGK